MSAFCPCHKNWWSKCPRTCGGLHGIDKHGEGPRCQMMIERTEFVNPIMAYRHEPAGQLEYNDYGTPREAWQVINTHPFMATEQTIWNFPLWEWDMVVTFTRKSDGE